MHNCALCGRAFTTKVNLSYHLHCSKTPCTVVKRSDTVLRSGFASTGVNRTPHPIMTEGSNFRVSITRHSPSPSSLPQVWDKACALFDEPGRNVLRDGHHQQTTISLSEASVLLTLLHGTVMPIVGILAGLGVRHVPGTRIHLCHTLPNAPPGQTVLAHSDPHPNLFFQLFGRKQVVMGGFHKARSGGAGNTQTLSSKEYTVFRSVSSDRVLVPGNVVGFAKRQIHHLTTVDTPNLSLSITVSITK